MNMVIYSEIPDMPQPAQKKPLISRRSASLSLVVLVIFLLYVTYSILAEQSYAYSSAAYNCTRYYFNEVHNSSAALAAQFFAPGQNISHQLRIACYQLQQENTHVSVTFPYP